MKRVTKVEDVELILAKTAELAEIAITSGQLIYADGTTNEKALFSLLEEAVGQAGFSEHSAELVSGHKFPDVIFKDARVGVEIKGHKQGDRILGNSIMGSTPSLENPLAIYLLAWNESTKKVIWRNYFDCVIGAEVTHSPRFVLKPNCGVDESLFGDGPNQIGEAQEICLGSSGFKSEVILARMRAKALADGNIPWWVSPHEDDEIHAAHNAQKQLSIVKYSSLDANTERRSFLKTLLIGFPELFGKSQTKYDRALVWALLRKSILISRDAFSAGGQTEEYIPSICGSSPLTIPKVFDRAKDLFDSQAEVKKSDIEDIWQMPNLTAEKLLSELKICIFNSGISMYRKQILHGNCECSQMTPEQFAERITDWLLEDLKPDSIN